MADTVTTERCPNCALLLLRPKDAVEPHAARVEELLRHNHPPLDIEISAVRQVVEDRRRTLADLNSKIGQARELLKNLHSAREQAQLRLKEAKSILHPMRSLPSELIAEIFRYCVPTVYQSEDPDVLDPRGAPWVFSEVCRRWREFAVSTPQLWTHLLLDFDKHEGHITERQCAYKMGLFIQRSRGLPMDVYLGSNENIAKHPVVPVLEVSIPQWRYLHVDLPQKSLQALSGNSFLSLQRLRLRSHISDVHLNLFQPMRTPVLRALEAIPGESWRTFQHVSLPWSHLTSVRNFPAFDAEALTLLRTTRDLMDLHVVAISGTRTPVQDVVLLSKLTCFTITEEEDAAGRGKEFFSSLVAIPNLSKLTLNYHPTSVLHFPVSPLPLGNLIKLDIICETSAHQENTQNLLDFLALTHRVEWLRLNDSQLTAKFADGLNLDKIPDGLPAILPCLRSLDIHKCTFAPALDDDLDQLFEMLSSRLPVVMVEGTLGEEETDASFGAANGGFEGIPRSDSEVDHRRSLKRVRLGRDLYVEMRTEWPDLFLSLASSVELEGN